MSELTFSTPAPIHPSALRCRAQALAGKANTGDQEKIWFFDVPSDWQPCFQAVAKIQARTLHVRKMFVGSSVCIQGRKN
jgi:hypothetical protein